MKMDKKDLEHLKLITDMHQDPLVVMQSALIEWKHGKGAEAALQWIVNTLVGPGLLPNPEAPYGKEAQAWFPREPKGATMDNNDLMRLKPQVDGYRMGAQQKRERFLRAPTRASLKEPNSDAGQQSSQAQAQEQVPGHLCGQGCKKCAAAARGRALTHEESRQILEQRAKEAGLWLDAQDQQLRQMGVDLRGRPEFERSAGAVIGQALAVAGSAPVLPADLLAMKDQAEKESVRQQVERRLHDLAELHDLAIQAAAVLAPHEQRVVQEALELNERLEKLTTFVGGPVCAGLDEQDRRLLYRQHAAMTVLAFVLDTRIQRFNLASAADFEGGEV